RRPVRPRPVRTRGWGRARAWSIDAIDAAEPHRALSQQLRVATGPAVADQLLERPLDAGEDRDLARVSGMYRHADDIERLQRGARQRGEGERGGCPHRRAAGPGNHRAAHEYLSRPGAPDAQVVFRQREIA